MGASISTTSSVNDMVNEQVTKIMTSSFSSCDMKTEQSQDSVIIGNEDSEFTVEQNMSLKVLATCEITNNIINDIKSNIDTTLKDQKDIETQAPLVGLQYTSADFLTKIRNTISNEINTDTVSNITQSVKALQNSVIANNKGSKFKVTQQMAGDIILTAVIKNKVINEALNELKAQIESDWKIKNTGFTFNWNYLLYVLIAFCAAVLLWYGVPIIAGLFSKKNNNRNYNNRDNNRRSRWRRY